MADPFTTPRDSYHPTVQRKMRDVDMDFSRMDDINYLRYRNVQLETELAFLREQLARAHSGTQYVINCFTQSRTLSSATSIHRDESRLLHERAEDAHCTQRPGFTRDHIEFAYKTEKIGNHHLQSNDFHSEPYHDHPAGLHSGTPTAQTFAQKDLLTFENDDSATTAANLQSPAPSFQSNANAGPSPDGSSFNTSFTSATSVDSDVPRYTKQSEAKNVGLGIHDARSQHQGETSPSWDLHRAPTYALETRKPRGNEHDSTLPRRATDVAIPAPTKQWSAIRSSPSSETDMAFDTRFFDREHNSLLNSACFIEEMTGEEREQHWVTLERERGRHNAKEWKMYYKRVVRPAYLAKTAKTAMSPSSTSTNVMRGRTVLVEQGDIRELVEAHTKAPDAHSEIEAKSKCDLPLDNNSRDVISVDRKTFHDDVEPPETPDHAFTGTHQVERQARKSNGARQSSYITSQTSHDTENVFGHQLPYITTPAKVRGGDGPDTRPRPAFSDLKASIHAPETKSSLNTASPLFASNATTPLCRRSPCPTFPTETSHILYSPDTQDPAHFRTILVSNIGPGITRPEIVSRMRGGRIVRARFLATNGMKTIPAMTTNTAMIEFLNADDAAAAFDMRFQEAQSSEVFDVTVLRTPTRPLHPKLELDMRDHGLSRVFFIVSDKQEWTPEAAMEEIVRCNSVQKRPLMAGQLQDDMLFFEFADVRDAAMAWEIVDRNQRCFRGVEKGFLLDPCSVRDDQVEGDVEGSSGSDADDEGDGGSTVVNTPEVSFETGVIDGMVESDGVA